VNKKVESGTHEQYGQRSSPDPCAHFFKGQRSYPTLRLEGMSHLNPVEGDLLQFNHSYVTHRLQSGTLRPMAGQGETDANEEGCCKL
jgi:hypothetical protein